MSEKKYLAIDVGGTFVKYALMGEDYSIIEKDRTPTVVEPLEAYLDSLVQIYRKYEDQVSGVAFSVPGVVEPDTGFLRSGGFLLCAYGIPFLEMMQKRIPVPVSVGNDAKCAAMAEVEKGSLADVNNGLVFVLGTGVGGAVVIDRKILNGNRFISGEFSMMTADPEETDFDRKSLGFHGGMRGLLAKVAEATGTAPEDWDGEKIFAKANAGDQLVLGALRAHVKGLVRVINNLCMVLDPEKVAVGGGISQQPLLFQLIQEELDAQYVDYREKYKIEEPKIVPCRFYNDANLIGALSLWFRRYGGVL